jgi:hypothetical protein
MHHTVRSAGLLAWIAAAPALAQAEPPEIQALSCAVMEQEASGALRLRVRFDNQGPDPIELPPGPQLILYADAAATDRFDAAARMDRVQRTPILVPANGQTEGLFAISAANTSALLCGKTTPAAAAMYFYRFSQRPQFRCILRGFELQTASCPAREGPAGNKQP